MRSNQTTLTMTDFFELPRPKPNANLQTLDMNSLGFKNPSMQDHNLPNKEEQDKVLEDKNPIPEKEAINEIINFSDNSQDEDRSGCNPDVQLVIQNIKESNDKILENNDANFDNEDDKDTYQESVAHESSTKKALQIIEENIQSLKKEEILSQNLSEKQKKPQKNKPLANNSQLSKKIQNIIDFGENDLGEVGEWVEKTANCNKQDEEADEKDSDFENVFDENQPKTDTQPKSQRESKEEPVKVTNSSRNVEKFGIGPSIIKKSSGGYMMNNLKDKAKSMLLAQGVATVQNEASKLSGNQQEKKPEVLI